MGARLETTSYHGVVILSSTFDKADLNSYLDALDVPSLIVCPRSFVAEQHRLTLGAIDIRVLGLPEYIFSNRLINCMALALRCSTYFSNLQSDLRGSLRESSSW